MDSCRNDCNSNANYRVIQEDFGAADRSRVPGKTPDWVDAFITAAGEPGQTEVSARAVGMGSGVRLS